MSQEGASAGVVLELEELLRQLACDGDTEKYIGGKYVREVGPWLSNAYDKWQGMAGPKWDGPGTLEALLNAKLGWLSPVYEEKLETCKGHLRAFRKEGTYGFTVTRYQTVALTVTVLWASGQEIVKIELRRDPATKYTIADGELMRQASQLVQFQHWQSLDLTAQDQTTVVYNKQEDVNFGQGTAMRRLAKEQRDIFGGDPGGTSDIQLEMDLLVDASGGEELRRVRRAVGGRVADAVVAASSATPVTTKGQGVALHQFLQQLRALSEY